MARKYSELTDVEKKCFDAFYYGKKEEALKLLPEFPNPETFRYNHWTQWLVFKGNDKDWTLLHYAARNGWEDVCKLLVEKYNCDPTAVDDRGRSPLHIACESGCDPSVKYLVTLPSVLRIINNKDTTKGLTPLHYACLSSHSSVIEVLLETNAVKVNEEDEDGRTPIEISCMCKYDNINIFAPKIDWSTQLPVKSFFSVFLVGNSGVGKSTLAAVMLELTKDRPPELFFPRIYHVEELTAGIVPTQCPGLFILKDNPKLFGVAFANIIYTEVISSKSRIEIYDLAGHSEYQSSHAAMLESLCLEAPAVFVLMVDLTKSADQLQKELYKWAHFLEIQSSRISCRVIVLGSRKDQFRLETELLNSKCKFVEQCAKDAFGNQHIAGFVALDTRELSSSNIEPFLQMLTDNVNDLLIPQMHEKMSFGCYFLYSFVKEKIKENAISLLHLQDLVSKEAFLCRVSDTVNLASMLEALANKGFLLFLRNSKHLPSSCIVVDKIRLLHEVNGILFAPSFFKEHCPVASNTGIVPVSRFHSLFPHYDREILIAFLVSLQFCRPLDPAVLSSITTNLSPETATSEQLLYFPALVSAERESSLSISSGFGYCAYCTNPHKCLTPRFNDSLFLDLAYSSCGEIQTPPKPEDQDQAAIRKLNRSCTVWKNGILWSTEDGIQAMVQVTEDNRCVSLSMSIDEECSSRWLKLRSSLTTLILSKKERFCPTVDFTEYFVSPSQLGLLSEKALSQLTVFEMKNVTQNMLLQNKFVCDVSQKERISPRSLLLADPYLVLPPTLVQQLFDRKKADELVPSSSLKEVRHHFKDIPVPVNMTYESLQKQLDNLSIFAGRNPMEVAGLKADDLPCVPTHDEQETAPLTSSIATTKMAKDEHAEKGLTHTQAEARVGEMHPSSCPTSWCLDSLTEGELDISHLRQLDQCLHKLNDWGTLGLYLDIPDWTLERIKMENDRRVADCKRAMLRHWLYTGSANKQALHDALRKMD